MTQFLTQAVADRPGRSTARSTAPWAGRPLRSTDVHSLVHVWQTQGRSTVRSTGPESLALCIWAVGRPVDRNRESALCIWAVDRAVDRIAPTVRNMTVGGRPGGRPPSLSGCQISLTASFLFGLYKPHFFGILAKFL